MSDWFQNISLNDTPYSVRIKAGHWYDEFRENRRVHFKHYYPDDLAEKAPVILWSHGLGGTKDGASYIARFVAGHGYNVIHIQHHGTDDVLWAGKGGDPWDHIRNAKIPRKATLSRYRDIPFAIDQLTGLAQTDAFYKDRLDLSRIGMSGHSFGALTTQIIAGQKQGRGQRMYSLADPRIKAGITYSPSLGLKWNNEDPKKVFGDITIPMLHMTGTEDHSPVSGRSYEHRKIIYEHASGKDHYLLVLKNGDHWIYNGTHYRGKKYPGNEEKHREIICVLSLAFWDQFLKSDQSAAQWLNEDIHKGYFQGEAAFYRKLS